MNITDLRTLPDDAALSADVCIVGSGPAGLTLAAGLNGSGLKVLLLESGDLERNAWAESMNEIVSVGRPRVLDTGEVRNRVLGGTSATWGGRVTMMSEIDFQKRDWVPGSGWPITLESLMPFYRRAAEHLRMTIADPNDALDVLASYVPPPDGDALVPYLWAYSMHNSLRSDFLRFGPMARTQPLADVECFVNATVTHIDTDESGRVVQALEVKGPDRRARRITARQVVLCAGGIENARLLLASNRIVPKGIGNGNDLVGRYLMDHPRGAVAWFLHGQEDPVQRLLGDLVVKASAVPEESRLPGASRRTWLTPGYALGTRIQQTEGLLNCALFLTLQVAEDDPLTALRALAGRNDPVRNARHLVAHPLLAGSSLTRMLRGRYPRRRLSGLYAQCIVEQSPDRESRVTLTDRTDILGVPLPQIDWRIGEQEARTVRRTTKLFVEEMRRLGLGNPQPIDSIADEQSEFFLPDVAHPSGTTRMSDDPALGVVDANGAVHGVEGLHVTGSSVFPTNGHANPTYTIVALAVRMADHLKETLKNRV
jgi:choline dehydrogenase-like flavoprotein